MRTQPMYLSVIPKAGIHSCRPIAVSPGVTLSSSPWSTPRRLESETALSTSPLLALVLLVPCNRSDRVSNGARRNAPALVSSNQRTELDEDDDSEGSRRAARRRSIEPLRRTSGTRATRIDHERRGRYRISELGSWGAMADGCVRCMSTGRGHSGASVRLRHCVGTLYDVRRT